MQHLFIRRATTTAAVATAFLTPAMTMAQESNVTVYGLLDITVRYAQNGQNSIADGAYTGSRFGLRGSEDLGGGMRAFFNLEMGIDPSTGSMLQSTTTANYGQSVATTGRAWGRHSQLGLATPYGTLSLGRLYTLAHDMSGRFQPQANPNQDSLSVFSGHHIARQDNMVKYNHQIGAFGVALSATAGEGNLGKAWGAAASYTAGPIDAVVYTQEMDSFNGAETRKILGLGGSYAVNKGLKLYAGGMQRSHAVSKQKNEVLTVGANYNLTDLLVLTASYISDHQTGVNAGRRNVALVGADYFLSKRTDVYAEVDQNRLTGAYPLPSFMIKRSSATGLSLGLRHRF